MNQTRCVATFISACWMAALGAAISVGAQGPDPALLERITTAPNFEARRESSSKPDLTENRDNKPIEIGDTYVLGDLEGPGVITHLWTTINTRDPFYTRSLVLRIYWDDAELPSVEVPFGDFFGVGNGAEAAYTSAPVVISARGRARTCYWRMPFKKHARVTVTNESKDYRIDSFYYYLDWEKVPALPEDAMYFHARYRQEMPAKPGNYVILDTEGTGQYVGTVYSVQQVETGWFGEGDDFFYIDGEKYPSLRGTGTEDYFGDAWGFRKFATPYFGVPVYEGVFPGDRVSAYRWHVPDPIPFKKSIHVEIEHKGSIFTDGAVFLGQYFERPDWISSVAFWYQTKPTTLPSSLPPVEQRIAPYRVLHTGDLKVEADPPMILQQGKGGVSYLPGQNNATISFSFDLAEAGRYQVNAVLEYSAINSIYEAFLDDVSLGPPMDLQVAEDDVSWVSFDLHDLDKGTHTLRFVGRGLSPKQRNMVPKAYAFGMSDLILLRLEDMAGYHEALEAALKSQKKP